MRSATSPGSLLFFFNDTATTEIYTLSLHDALPICRARLLGHGFPGPPRWGVQSSRLQALRIDRRTRPGSTRSEEHTSELQSRPHLVCRLLLEKKKDHSQCSSAHRALPSVVIYGAHT